MNFSFMQKKYLTMLAGGTLLSFTTSLVVMSDSVVAGIFQGVDAVAGVNLITPVYSLAAFFGLMFSLGVPIMYSKAMGRFEKEEADQYFGIGISVTLMTGIFLFILLSLFGKTYLGFFNISKEIYAQAVAYFFWMRFTILITPVMTLLNGMLFADGDESMCSLANASLVLGNILISSVLCPVLGTAGIGLGSFLGKLVALIISLLHFLKKSNTLKLNFFFSFKKLTEIMHYSMVDAGTYLFLAILILFLNKYIVVVYGTNMIFIVAVIAFAKEAELIFDGIGEAITPLAGIYLSEKSYDGVKKIINIAFISAMFEGILVLILMLILAPFIPAVLGFISDSSIRTAINGFRILAFGMPFICILFLITSFYLLTDRIVLGVLFSGMRDTIISIPLVFVLSHFFGIYGIFTAVALSPFLAVVM